MRRRLAEGSGVCHCDNCGHPMFRMDSVMLTFTRLNPDNLKVTQFKFRLCYRCADSRIWQLQDSLKKPVHCKGVTNEEYCALIGQG